VLPLAHAGHWAVYVLYAVPVLIVLGSILLTAVRSRGEEEDDADASGPAAP
jgi:hypothetical protein